VADHPDLVRNGIVHEAVLQRIKSADLRYAGVLPVEYTSGFRQSYGWPRTDLRMCDSSEASLFNALIARPEIANLVQRIQELDEERRSRALSVLFASSGTENSPKE